VIVQCAGLTGTLDKPRLLTSFPYTVANSGANAAMGGALMATAIGFVSLFSRLPVHPANTKANNRAMIRISAILFCQIFK
jgi:hypothetical protein